MSGVTIANPGWDGATPYAGADYQSDGAFAYIPRT